MTKLLKNRSNLLRINRKYEKLKSLIIRLREEGSLTMNTKYTWNQAFNFIMKLKRTYQNRVGTITNWDVNEWILELDMPEYNDFHQRVNMSCYKGLVLVKYSMINVGPDMWTDPNSIYREMRSVTIDLMNDALVLVPFRKFFNMNEVPETEYDLLVKKIENAKNIEISNKMDGSMQSARYYNGAIVMSGSQALDPERSPNLTEGLIFLTDNYKRMICENDEYTFNFEYISMGDAHVIIYSKDQEGLYLIGMRSVYTGEQLSYRKVKEVADKYGVKMTELEEGTLDELIAKTKLAKSNEKEGWVINIDGMLVKIKCDDYVNIHRILNKLSSINLVIHSIADGNYDDLVAKVPDIYRPRVTGAAKLIYDYVENTEKEICDWYARAPKSVKKTRKEFASWVKNSVPKKFQGYMWYKYDSGTYNLLKKFPDTECPKYITMKEMGYDVHYSALFGTEE